MAEMIKGVTPERLTLQTDAWLESYKDDLQKVIAEARDQVLMVQTEQRTRAPSLAPRCICKTHRNLDTGLELRVPHPELPCPVHAYED